MPTITIDDQVIDFTEGQTIIEAARAADITIPHFCWHPALTVAGNCRICLVEIEKMPKLNIACATPAADGMVVHTSSEKTIHAQNAVMEFLLINHPLDCPICDEAGECKLQDYSYKYSVGLSRFNEKKNSKDKRVPLGPNVMLDQERCIACSRCIRFCDEIAKDSELTFAQRGEHVVIDTFPGEQLDNPYSMDVIEICPVGALTSRHFRFKARVWDMSFTDTICPGCQRGCNTIMGVRNNEVLRIEPRVNNKVNDYWLCDWGRLNTIDHINDISKRIDSPHINIEKSIDGIDNLAKVDWDTAFSRTISELKNFDGSQICFVASPFSTLEDNYALKKFASAVFGNSNIFYMPYIDESFGDDILRRSDKTPNSTGCEMLGIKPLDDTMQRRLESGEFKVIYAINDDLTRIPNSGLILKNVKVIQHLSVHNGYSHNSTVLLSEALYAEINGTFVNFQKRIQRIRPAVSTLEQERLLGDFSLSRLDKFGAHNDRWTKGYKFDARPTWKILKQLAKAMNGTHFDFENSEDVFTELCSTIPGLEGSDYDTLSHSGITAGEKKETIQS
jgi:NADH-quinone oxidoreductase subunit G